MPKKKDQNRQVNVKVGNLSNLSGAVNVAGGDITTHQTTSDLGAVEIKALFQGIYASIEARPQTPAADKQDLKAELQEVEAAITQAAVAQQKPDEAFLVRRFRNIASIAPDILDVAVAALTNPLAGLGVAVQKIAKKAKIEGG